MAVVDGEDFPVSSAIATASSLLALSVTAYLAYLLTMYVKKVKKIGQIVDKFQGPKKHWLFGNLLEHPGLNEKGMSWATGMARKYRTSFRLWYGPFCSSVICIHPSTVRTVLQSTEPKQINGMYGMLRDWLGDGLLLSSGKKWFRNRKLMTPAFHFDVLKPYMKIYNEAADIFLKQLETDSESGSVEICNPVRLLTLNVILRCAFSSDMDVQRQGKSHPYVNAVTCMATLLVERFLNPILHNDFVYSLSRSGRQKKKHLAVVHSLSEDVIVKRKAKLRENPEETQKRYLDFLDILLLARDEDGEGLTDREIRDEVDTFLFEGHDTTASAISWLLYELARNPDHQQTCREEVKQFLSNRETGNVDWDDLPKLQFTTQCIKEAMRMHSPVPVIAREVSKEFEVDGITILPGTFVEICIYLCHHNEDVWGQDHMEYKPERFNPERMEQMDPFAFVPHSAGPRGCIGQTFAMQEIKVVVSKALHRFSFTLDQTHTVERLPEVVMRAANGIKLFIEPLR